MHHDTIILSLLFPTKVKTLTVCMFVDFQKLVDLILMLYHILIDVDLRSLFQSALISAAAIHLSLISDMSTVSVAYLSDQFI